MRGEGVGEDVYMYVYVHVHLSHGGCTDYIFLSR